MADDKRNPEIDETASPTYRKTARSGTGTHEVHRHQAEQSGADRHAIGVAARQEGYNRPGPDIVTNEIDEGDEPMTGKQAERLRILAQEAGQVFNPRVGQREADRLIREYQRRAGLKP